MILFQFWRGQSWRLNSSAFHRWLIEQRKWNDLQATRRSAPNPREHLLALRQEHQQRLRPLEVIEARMGYNTPPETLNQIQDIRRKIAEIEQRLGMKG